MSSSIWAAIKNTIDWVDYKQQKYISHITFLEAGTYKIKALEDSVSDKVLFLIDSVFSLSLYVVEGVKAAALGLFYKGTHLTMRIPHDLIIP